MRPVEIPLSRLPEDSADETLVELDLNKTVMDADRTPRRSLGKNKQEQEMENSEMDAKDRVE